MDSPRFFFYAKITLVVIQVALFVLTITSGVQLKKVNDGREALRLFPSNPLYEEALSKLDMQWGLLVTVVVLSSLKIPIVSFGLFLHHIIILFAGFMLDVIISCMYLSHLAVASDVYTAGAVFGMLFSLSSFTITLYLIRRIKTGNT